jgi:hypothetical protein
MWNICEGAVHFFARSLATARAATPLDAKNCITPNLSLVTMGKAQRKKLVQEANYSKGLVSCQEREQSNTVAARDLQ